VSEGTRGPRAMEALHPDGSITQVHEDGTVTIDGPIAVRRWEMISAINGLKLNIRTEGRMHVRRGYTQQCVAFASMLTGKKYPRSMNGKKAAMADLEQMVADLNRAAVVLDSND
jgi:hypothetical protein